jgi:hypothetical protein
MTPELLISVIAIIITVLLLIFVVNWQYFRDWIVVLLFQMALDFLWGSPVVKLKLINYPVRLLPHFYTTCILFELIIFPVLCVLYNQITREKGLIPILFYALLFSAGICTIEYPLELYTSLIKYIHWTWFTSFYTLAVTFLLSRTFIAFFRWGCRYFSPK